MKLHKKIARNKCPYVFVQGQRKGQVCGVNVRNPNHMYCSNCGRRIEAREHTQESEEPVAYAQELYEALLDPWQPALTIDDDGFMLLWGEGRPKVLGIVRGSKLDTLTLEDMLLALNHDYELDDFLKFETVEILECGVVGSGSS